MILRRLVGPVQVLLIFMLIELLNALHCFHAIEAFEYKSPSKWMLYQREIPVIDLL